MTLSSSQKSNFKMRGTEVTRLETFMDAAFAFAMTMLVISVGTLPKNYTELITSLKEIPAFLCSFFIIMLFWLSHRTWSRRYGLEDKRTLFLSIGLIFVLLVYMYPLRLIFSTLFAYLSNGWFPTTFESTSLSDITGLFAIYGIGLFAMAGILALLYQRAFQKKELLQLDRYEAIQTKSKRSLLTIVSVTGLIAALLAALLPASAALQSSLIYLLLPIAIIISKRYYEKQVTGHSSN